MNKKTFTALNIPTSLVEELRVWKMAFGLAYGDPSFSYERMIRGMLDSLPQTEPGVVQALDELVKKNPDLMDRLAGYKENQ